MVHIHTPHNSCMRLSDMCGYILLSLSLSLSPLVMAVCPDFSQAHGTFQVSNQHFGRYTEDTRVVVACDGGYQPTEGATDVVCLAAGTWSPHMPACSGMTGFRNRFDKIVFQLPNDYIVKSRSEDHTIMFVWFANRT